MAAFASDSAALGRIREYNLQTAELAAAGKRELLVQLLIDAASTEEPELRRKIFDTVGKESVSQDPKQPISISAPLSFQIILDDTPQVAPPRRARAIPRQEDLDIEDAVPFQLPDHSEPFDAPLPPPPLRASLEFLAAALCMAEDE